MTPDEMAKARYLIENDRQHYRAYMGVQFLLDAFEKTLNALEKTQEENEQLKVEIEEMKRPFKPTKATNQVTKINIELPKEVITRETLEDLGFR